MLHRLVWLVNELQRSPCLWLLCIEIANAHYHAWHFYMDSVGLEPGPTASKARALPSELLPQPMLSRLYNQSLWMSIFVN